MACLIGLCLSPEVWSLTTYSETSGMVLCHAYPSQALTHHVAPCLRLAAFCGLPWSQDWMPAALGPTAWPHGLLSTQGLLFLLNCNTRSGCHMQGQAAMCIVALFGPSRATRNGILEVSGKDRGSSWGVRKATVENISLAPEDLKPKAYHALVMTGYLWRKLVCW